MKEAYRYAGCEWRALLRNATPLILLTVAVVLFIIILGLMADGQTDGNNFQLNGSFGIGLWFVPFAAVLVGIVLAITYAVSVHRRFLLGSDGTGIFNILQWQRRHWRFLGWTILVGIGMGLLSWLIILVVGVPLGFLLDFMAIDVFFVMADNFFVSEALSLLLWFAVIFIVGLAFLRLPDFAIDASDRGRLTGILFLGELLPFLLFKYLIVLVPTGLGALFVSDESSDVLGALLVGGAFGVLGLLYMISWLALTAILLSVAYQRLRDNAPPQPTPEPA